MARVKATAAAPKKGAAKGRGEKTKATAAAPKKGAAKAKATAAAKTSKS